MSPHNGATPIPVAIASLGTIGRTVARQIVDTLPEYALVAASARRRESARDFLQEIGSSAEVVDIAELSQHADLVIECAPAGLFRDIVEPVVLAGKRVIILSVGALLDSWDLVDKAKAAGGQILVPSGALLALDAVQAAAQGQIHSVRMETRKPLAGLRGAPFIEENGIDLDTVTEPLLIFKGTAREAISRFPANLNVSIALSLAGIGPDRTLLEVWADPSVNKNTHRIHVDSDAAILDFTVRNIPSENPKTGRLTALSVVALLRKLVSPLRIGT